MAGSSQPNVVVFFTDQQRWDSSSLYGNPLNLTPNYDRMAQEGTHLYRAYTCQPVCMPARSSLQTGKYASETGCHTNGGCLPADEMTLGHWFRDAGYRTGYVGKWHLCKEEPVPPAYRFGYDHWLGSNILEFTSDAYRTYMYDNDGNKVRLPGYRADALADEGIRFINQNQDQPFFLMMSFIEPHHQNHRDDYPAPEGYREQYQGRWTPPDLGAMEGSAAYHLGGYWGCIKRLDEAFGRVVDALRSLSLLENTIVVYTTDHGNHFKTRNREYKRACHESCSRIPLAISGPGFNGGGRVQEPVSLIDLPPTLLDAAGIDVPETMQGRSMLPLANRQAQSWPEEAFIQISESQTGRAIATKRWKYSVTASGEWKQVKNADTYHEDCLYDLASDPYEQSNLIGIESLAEVKADLRQRLLKRIKEVEGQEPTIILAETGHGGHRYHVGNAPDDPLAYF